MTDITHNLDEADRLAADVDGLVDQLLDKVERINEYRAQARRGFKAEKPFDGGRNWLLTEHVERMLQHRLQGLNLGRREPFKPKAATLADYLHGLHDGVRRQLR
jgi:hypothetical protein|tara:strand:+ start:287 stop:598 length:312 start_codon:yes stop_codon:yes gene_type:complete